ncbi:MAG: c-type cytochrome [Dehalococcoidia bacterium]
MNHDLGKKVIIGLALTVLLIVLTGVYFVTEPGRQRAAGEEFTRKASLIGAEHFLVTCAQCHGPRGEGGIGRPLRDTKLDENTLIKTISRGRPGTAMPAFAAEEGGVFTVYQIRDIVEFIRHWSDDILDEERHRLLEEGVLTPTPPTPSAITGTEGPQLFQQLQCGACHTIEGVSTGQLAPELSHIGSVAGERQPGTPARDYIEQSLLDPPAFVVEGFNPIMPSIEGRLSPEQLQALVDYLLTLDGAAGAPAPTPTLAPTATPPPTTAQALELFQQLQCGVCHTIEGVSIGELAPELNDIGSVAGGRQPGVSARDYIQESLLKPEAFVVESFNPIMPSIEGRLSPEELQALVDYLLSLK